MRPQIMRSPAGERLAGREYTSAQLAELLNQQTAILSENEGGITFSGGEPLMQAEFVAEVMDLLRNAHVLLDTCGFGSEMDFQKLLDRSDLIYFDLKLIDPAAHLHYTAQDNSPIFSNLKTLSRSEKPFVVRVPLVPGVTDTDENLNAIARTIAGLRGLERVDLLPYNRAAGSKYRCAGLEFRPDYDELRPVNINMTPFEHLGVKVLVA